MRILFVLLFIVSCGKMDVKVPNTKHTVNVDGDVEGRVDGEANININTIDYRDIADFCDDRYGEETEDAEECFKDLSRPFTVRFDSSGMTGGGLTDEQIIQYCTIKHSDEPRKIEGCIEEFGEFSNYLDENPDA